MTSPIQRSRHSELPEGPGFTSGFTNRADSQRDLWRFVLPYGHLQAAGLRGGGVVEGLRVSGTAGSPGLMVTPGQALDGRGRLLVIPPPTGSDLVVRLRRVATADVGTEGLAAVGAEGVAVPTTGLSGEHLLVLEWSETRLTLDGETIYRLTPWLRLEQPPATPKDEWAVLARVTLGSGAEEGQVKSLDAGPRRALTSLRDGLTISRPLAVTDAAGAWRVEQEPASALRARPDGGLDVSTWDTAASTWRAALSVDGATGGVSAPVLSAKALTVDGDIAARGLTVDAATVGGDLAVDGRLTSAALMTGAVRADDLRSRVARFEELETETVAASSVTVESLRLPLIRAGQTDPATTPWQPYAVDSVMVDIDTSAADFPETPAYFASVAGVSNHFTMTGTNAVYLSTRTGFRLYLRHSKGAPVTVANAKQWGWYINWVGVLPR